MTRTVARLGALLGAALALAGATAAPAAAHAQLESTSPPRGAVLERSPARVVLRFDEPVEGNFGAVRVFAAAGERVDRGEPHHPGGRSERLAVALEPDLPDGTYTVTYRVVSADAHVISGGTNFFVGRPGAAGRTVAELLGDERTGPVTDVAFGLARGLQFAAIALALGALGFLLLVWRRALPAAAGDPAADAARAQRDDDVAPAAAAFARRVRMLVVGAAAVGAVSAAAAIALQGAEAAAVSGWEAMRPAIVRETLGTRFGAVWGLGVVAWAALGTIAWVALGARASRPAPSPLAVLALGPPALFLALLPGLGGHAGNARPTALLLAANLVHVVAMALWAGGLATILVALPAATRRLAAPAARSRLLAAVLARFSPIALCCVAAILVTGILQSIVYLDALSDLIETAFGRAILVKGALLVALVALGAWQRSRSLPRLRRIAAAGETPGRAGVLLRRALRAEVALLLGVLGATAVLAASSPSSATAPAGPFDASTTIGPLQLEVVVDPAARGPNTIHLYLLDPRDGRQFRGAREVVLDASLPERAIGPLRDEPLVAGPGHFSSAAMQLGVAGTWQLRVTVRVSDFDQYETTLEVPIR